MKIKRIIHKRLLFFFALLICANNSDVIAGTVTIVNKTDANIRIDVLYDSSSESYCKTCLDGCMQINGKHTTKIIVPLNSFKNCNYFTLADMVDGFLGNGECKHLSVLKNYEVTFFETRLGTKCQYKEI